MYDPELPDGGRGPLLTTKAYIFIVVSVLAAIWFGLWLLTHASQPLVWQ